MGVATDVKSYYCRTKVSELLLSLSLVSFHSPLNALVSSSILVASCLYHYAATSELALSTYIYDSIILYQAPVYQRVYFFFKLQQYDMHDCGVYHALGIESTILVFGFNHGYDTAINSIV